MEQQEFRKLKREALLEILYSQAEQIEHLQDQVTKLQAKLDERILAIEKAGTLAEASAVINGLFEAAQNTASQYLDNVISKSENAPAEITIEWKPAAKETSTSLPHASSLIQSEAADETIAASVSGETEHDDLEHFPSNPDETELTEEGKMNSEPASETDSETPDSKKQERVAPDPAAKTDLSNDIRPAADSGDSSEPVSETDPISRRERYRRFRANYLKGVKR